MHGEGHLNDSIIFMAAGLLVLFMIMFSIHVL